MYTQTHTIPKDIVSGLLASEKKVSSKYLYDKTGAELFEKLTEQPEYYIFNSEMDILKTFQNEIGGLLNEKQTLVELGSGVSPKTGLLLNQLKVGQTYLAVDISESSLLKSGKYYASRFPELQIKSLHADYTKPKALESLSVDHPSKTIVFLGSTLGNFEKNERQKFFQELSNAMQKGDRFMIGYDLKKETGIIENAYRDKKGILEKLNKNLLQRMRSEFEMNFNPTFFEHYSYYNPIHNRMELHLINRKSQTLSFHGKTIRMERDETIQTAISYKFYLENLDLELRGFGLEHKHTWTDKNNWFNLSYFEKTGH